MIVIAGPASPPRLEDSNEFRSLEVVWAAPGPPDASAIEPAGWLEGEHVWLNPKWMREQGRENGPDWGLSFDEMVDYARNKGWVDADGFLRAHIVQKPHGRAIEADGS